MKVLVFMLTLAITIVSSCGGQRFPIIECPDWSRNYLDSRSCEIDNADFSVSTDQEVKLGSWEIAQAYFFSRTVVNQPVNVTFLKDERDLDTVNTILLGQYYIKSKDATASFRLRAAGNETINVKIIKVRRSPS